jgi:L-cystine uptake protein TcyP (sodium:dicarboxylate symporter family)
MKPLGDGFIKLIKMIIAPIIFCTIVVGIAGMEDMKKVGKTGGLALLYFEVVSTIALIVGLVVVNVWAAGCGMNVDVATLDTKAHRQVRRARQDADDGGFPAEHHPDQRRRRLREGRHAAGAVLLHPVRLRAACLRASAASRCST